MISPHTHQWGKWTVRPRLALAALAVLAAAFLSVARPAIADGPVVIYDAYEDGIPGNVVSLGFEATSTSEFGDHIAFAGTDRNLESASVVMSSWGCESGSWNGGDCATTPGATFEHEITLTFYEVVEEDGVPTAGPIIATKTQTFAIPYRPSSDATNCTDGRWYSADEDACFNGLATEITFTFAGQLLPDEVIWGISYNTTHYGAEPIGQGAACFAESGGCGYDSLNVGADSFSSVIGTDVEEEAAFLDSTWAGAYCDGGADGTGTFRYDGTTDCWSDYRPLIRVNAQEPLPPITVIVTGNTAAGENQPGWMFNRDTSTSTPYTFTDSIQSIGSGSLHVLPIGANASDKFIAELFLLQPLADIEEISYDFQIGPGGEGTDEEQFYMSVYANFEESSDTKFYDCRYAVIPTVGSTAGFTTVTFDPDLEYPVTTRGGADPSPEPCPASPAGMGAGATLRVISINVGDTSASDVGLDGYLDNVVVNLAGQTTIYDFEAISPTSKDQCKKGGWMTFNSPVFVDQGSCVSYVNHLP